jgi:oligopeptidase B
LVVYSRRDGLQRLEIRDSEGGNPRSVEFPEPVYSFYAGENPEYDTDHLRYYYNSLLTPTTIYELNLRTREQKILKQVKVLGDYHPEDYVQERIFATAADGARIPIILVHRRDLVRDGSAPLLLTGYGAYGISSDVYFSHSRLSLLRRGFVWGIAQVRGGEEMGRQWYLQGRLHQKKNSFTDFAACARHLVQEGYTSPEKLAFNGGSAGGLLVMATVNLDPTLCGAAVAEVPFVDVLNTMLDPSLPLTVTEYEEWGDPHHPADYAYIKSYSPYENLCRCDYPALLLTAGLNDPRVGFWEPAKLVARLRTLNTGNRPLLLKTEMGEGHLGASGRYDQFRDTAFVYAFIITNLGVNP